MTATLILVRHAAHGHLDKMLSGRMPGVPLTDEGRAQAARLARRLGGRGIGAVLSSPLDRAQETARAVADAAGVSVETAAPLVEIDLGEWTGRSFDELRGDPAWDRWNQERATARPPGGESMAEAQTRIVPFLDSVAGGNGGRTVALVSHSDMIRSAVAHVLGLSLNDLHRFDVEPASATTLHWGDWGAKLHRLNEGED